MERIDYTLVIDAPREYADGRTTRVVVLDTAGKEVGWFSIDDGIADLAPTAEHPDREYLGWPECVEGDVSFYNGVDEGWAVPSYYHGVTAALYEHAFRVADRWYRDNMR